MIAPESLMAIAMSRSDDPPGADAFLPLPPPRSLAELVCGNKVSDTGARAGGTIGSRPRLRARADETIRSYAQNIGLSLSHVAVDPTAPTVTPRGMVVDAAAGRPGCSATSRPSG